MAKFQLHIKQREIYPRCRISQDFLADLMKDRDIYTNGCPGLFLYSALCAYASPCHTILRQGGISYTVRPGECLCTVKELTHILRLHAQRQAMENLWVMQNRGLIQYTLLDRGRMLKYKIMDWRFNNNVLAYDCPNQKLSSFFYLSATTVSELVSAVKCSPMDILLDLLFSSVFQRKQVKGSFSGPVVYFRNGTNSPVVSYEELAQRWGISVSAVHRVLKKLEGAGYISVRGYPGAPRAVIYLAGELSTAFQASDVMLDKAELPMEICVDLTVTENDITGLGDLVAEKVLQILSMQGLACAGCQKCTHRLYPLTEDKKANAAIHTCTSFRMEVLCTWKTPICTFDIHVVPNK